MNKAFDKIIEKLKEEKMSYFLTIANTGDEKLDCAYEQVGNALDKAIEIVIQEAEKYNNGWIPCSDQLPDKRDWYLAMFQEVDTGFIGLPFIADYLMGSHTNSTTEDGWIIANCTEIEEDRAEYYKKLKCIAWRPLPQPYQPKGE